MRAANRFLRSGVAPILILVGISIFAVSLAHAQDGNYIVLLSAYASDISPEEYPFQYTDVPVYVTLTRGNLSGSGTDPNGLLFSLNGTCDNAGALHFFTEGPGLCPPFAPGSCRGHWNGSKQGTSALGSVEWEAFIYPCPCPPSPYPCGCMGLWEGNFTATFQPYGGGGVAVEGAASLRAI